MSETRGIEYEIGKGLWKATKGAGIAALVLLVAQLGDVKTFSDALPAGAPEAVAVAAAALVRLLANYLKMKGLFG